MTKNILLATAAAGVMVLAGQATAQEITVAEVSGVSVIDSPYPVASETVNISSNRVASATAGANDVAFIFTNDDGEGLSAEAGARYRFVQSFTGAVLAAAVTATDRAVQINGADIVGADLISCFTISTNTGTGTSGATSVSYDVAVAAASAGADSGATACEATAFAAATSGTFGFRFDKAFRTPAINSVSTTITGSLSPSNALVSADDRSTFSLAQPLAAVTNGYSVVIAADTGTTQLSLTSDPIYTALAAGDDVIGEVGYAPTVLIAAGPDADFAETAANVGYNNTALPAVVADLELEAVGGTFEFITPSFDGEEFEIDADDNTLATFADASGIGDVTIAITGAPTESVSLNPIGFNVTVTPELVNDADDALVNIDAAGEGALQPLALEGSSFLAPWVQSTNANYNTVIRISNAGAATGAVILSLSSSLTAPTAATCDTADLTKLASIPANGELAINSADLTECFGAFGRGDLTITVLSLNDNLTAKLRVVNPGNIVSELTLNRTSGSSF